MSKVRRGWPYLRCVWCRDRAVAARLGSFCLQPSSPSWLPVKLGRQGTTTMVRTVTTRTNVNTWIRQVSIQSLVGHHSKIFGGLYRDLCQRLAVRVCYSNPTWNSAWIARIAFWSIYIFAWNLPFFLSCSKIKITTESSRTVHCRCKRMFCIGTGNL